MSIYDQIAERIIKEQELLIGPIAWYEAGKVEGLVVKDNKKGIVAVNAKNGGAVVNKLVDRFTNIFGRAGQEVCKESVSALIADMQPSQIPASLK
ncbi:MAG TPA: hypothetical protein VHA78_02790 [Candidatus Peribacteraceae bacterium]|nr:hypothetical protein [Candidatus Peribacteraceae bacterium]